MLAIGQFVTESGRGKTGRVVALRPQGMVDVKYPGEPVQRRNGSKLHAKRNPARGTNNQRGYKFYVVVGGRIESGWEYTEDAADRRKELLAAGYAGTLKLSKIGLKKFNLDPNNNAHWHGVLPAAGKHFARNPRAASKRVVPAPGTWVSHASGIVAGPVVRNEKGGTTIVLNRFRGVDEPVRVRTRHLYDGTRGGFQEAKGMEFGEAREACAVKKFPVLKPNSRVRRNHHVGRGERITTPWGRKGRVTGPPVAGRYPVAWDDGHIGKVDDTPRKAIPLRSNRGAKVTVRKASGANQAAANEYVSIVAYTIATGGKKPVPLRTAFAIAGRQLQRSGHLHPGTRQLTPKGFKALQAQVAVSDYAARKRAIEFWLARGRKAKGRRVIQVSTQAWKVEPDGVLFTNENEALKYARGKGIVRARSTKRAVGKAAKARARRKRSR